jgi:very-short-patch-repair endonuclease
MFSEETLQQKRYQMIGNSFGSRNQGKTHTVATKQKIRNWNVGRKMGPMSEELKKVHADRMVSFLLAHSDQHVNVKLNKLNRKTSLHVKLAKLLSSMGFTFVEEYPVRDTVGIMYIDMVLVNSKIAFEADGSYWHPLDEVRARDHRLRSLGWAIFHFRDGDFGFGMPNESVLGVLRRYGCEN